MFAVFGCTNNEVFDSVKWKSNPIDANIDTYRENMSTDLIKGGYLDGKTKFAVSQILGEVENGMSKSDTFIYLVVEKYGTDIDPIYIKELEVIFANDTVSNYAIIK